MSRYRFKNIFLGIGIGLIIASAVNLNTSKPQLSIQDIKNEAEKRGMVVFDSKELADKQQSNQTHTTPPAVPQTSKPTEVQTVDINVRPGDTSEQIGIMLEASGLITDRNDFIKRVYQTKSGHNMQTGKYTVAKGSSIDEIIRILTTRKNTP